MRVQAAVVDRVTHDLRPTPSTCHSGTERLAASGCGPRATEEEAVLNSQEPIGSLRNNNSNALQMANCMRHWGRTCFTESPRRRTPGAAAPSLVEPGSTAADPKPRPTGSRRPWASTEQPCNEIGSPRPSPCAESRPSRAPRRYDATTAASPSPRNPLHAPVCRDERHGLVTAGRLKLPLLALLRSAATAMRSAPDKMAASSASAAVSRKRQGRRRRQDKPAISARLVLDDHIKGDVGILSEDLFADLFPHLRDSSDDEQPAQIHHVAVSPWVPNATPSDTAWSIVPVVRSAALAHSTVQFSPSSPALQTFAVTLQQVAPSRLSSHSRSGIEILVLDVSPLPLETVFVSLESESTKRLENGQGTFYREHPTNPRGKAASKMTTEQLLTTAIRTALASLKVVHAGDLFPLPLAPHHVTHVPPNPGKIMLCEPVAQGILTDATKIVLMRGRVRTRQARSQASMAASHRLNGVTEEDEANTDQFFSAAEERYRTDARADETETATETETEGSDLEQEDGLSDDSMDDMISLQAPALPPTNVSGLGTMQPGTPMTIGTLRGRKTNGATTPGSIFSNFTSATARPDRPRGRLFKAQGLLKPMPSDLLHPKPAPEEDEEARIYVDMSSLPKIGCFSGDWARIEVAEEPPLNGFGAFGLGGFGHAEPDASDWRPVRVYGLPEGYSQRPVTRIPSSRPGERKMSFFESQVQRPTSPAAYASPVLLANLGNATHMRISALKKSSYQGKGTLPRFASASHPPYAKDIAIHHIRTPISAERAYQTAVLGGLKRYFAQKVRLVRTGDLIAVPVDAQLGRVLQEGPGAGGSEVDDVMALTADSNKNGQSSSHIDSVAWFKVGHIQVQKADDDEDGTAEAFWGSVARGSDPTTPAFAEHKQQYVSPLRRQLRELLAAATSQRAIHLKMPPIAILLTSTHRNIGKSTLATTACADIGLHRYSIDAYDILSEGGGSGSDVKTEGFLRTRAERAMSCGPDCCALLIQHVEALTADRIESTMKEILEETRVLLATTNEVDQVPDGVRGLFTHELEMGAPDEAEREAILRAVVDDRGVSLDPTIDLNSVALKTAALVAGDLVDVVERASIARQARLEQLSTKTSSNGAVVTVRDVQVAGGPLARSLTAADFDVAVEAARKNFSDSIGAPKIPNVTWNDVGGLSNVKDAVTETIQLPLERPELFAKGMKKRSGILFYGPPGTGKTLLAKAIATEYSLNFFSVKGPELLNMYIGESEANVRRVFQRARDARPCVVFFDELDSVAPKRGNQGDSGGVMDRIVSQLLAELDGMSGGEDAGGVFVIGATNRPDLLDPALLRPGRFDKMLYLGVSDTHDKQLTILEALTRKFILHPSVSLKAVSERLPFTYTGADFYALCSDAMLKAVTRQAAGVDAKVKAINAERGGEHDISTAYYFDHYATPEDIAVMVTEADFMAAHEELIPSVSAAELAHYEKVRAAFEGVGDTPAPMLQQRRLVAAAPPKNRVSSSASAGKAGKGKGKGKAIALTSDDEYDSEEDDLGGAVNGDSKGKGKAVVGFQDGTASDDEGLY
ncbi:Peroxisomal biogenesis factor 6 [Tolypocladium ophioglossoides CBS 100239]|uniref:Peroxisomal ATPase PEX6 n=1 Tax=Tolypocladium ophioglossoides (strain CBS 100239) TaxID=1163406 RepID=A0A0L0NDR0_TOLOC|nr:Peroxisomal biogenesis factor 6 [Tolypocladium ophioglossoides CBS 100239]